MQKYKPRKIEFRSLAVVNDWNIKVYSITHQDSFKATTVINYAVNKFPKWLVKTEKLGLETYKIAFLIIHEGRDGVWTLFNCWIGENMLQTLTFYTSYEDITAFQETPEGGGIACVWELEVINFERNMWIEHILKKAEKPDFKGYLECNLSQQI